VGDRADDRRALLGGLRIAEAPAPVARVRAAVAATAGPADLLEGRCGCGGGRLELSLGVSDAGHLAGVRRDQTAAAVRSLEANAVLTVRTASVRSERDGLGRRRVCGRLARRGRRGRCGRRLGLDRVRRVGLVAAAMALVMTVRVAVSVAVGRRVPGASPDLRGTLATAVPGPLVLLGLGAGDGPLCTTREQHDRNRAENGESR
jgi:hypothetical protein